MNKIYALDGYANSEKDFYVPENVKMLSYDISTGDFIDEYSIKENLRNGWFFE